MTNEEIQSVCLADRNESLKGVTVGWVKENCFDLFVKYLIFLINIMGKKTVKEGGYLFVDEVNNNSMRNNLLSTKDHFDEQHEKTSLLSLYRKTADSLKIGVCRPLFELIAVCLMFIPSLIAAVFKKNQTNRIIKILVNRFIKISHVFMISDRVYIMSDHHFFSSVLAMEYSDRCSVIQHGMVMGFNMYYPIRAGEFLAWGTHSKELLKNSEKVKIVGTYKFDKIKMCPPKDTFSKVIFCLNTLDEEIVRKKISVLYDVTEKLGWSLLVKCHPGSFYDQTKWEAEFRGKGICFFKEELIQDIDFDIAISENSTVVLDLISMNKPFVLYDTIDGYFSEYADLIPHAEEADKIQSILMNIGKYDFEAINKQLRSRELNDGKCLIYDYRKNH